MKATGSKKNFVTKKSRLIYFITVFILDIQHFGIFYKEKSELLRMTSGIFHGIPLELVV